MNQSPEKDPRPAARPIRPIPSQSESAGVGNSETDPVTSPVGGGGPLESKPWRPGCFTYFFGALIALVGWGMISGGGSDSNDGALVVACQNVVKSNLKSPSTANFVGVPASDGTYISGEVDAENSFGATMRSSFRCTIIDEQTVRLDYLK